jgi:hypothetical protein
MLINALDHLLLTVKDIQASYAFMLMYLIYRYVPSLITALRCILVR